MYSIIRDLAHYLSLRAYHKYQNSSKGKSDNKQDDQNMLRKKGTLASQVQLNSRQPQNQQPTKSNNAAPVASMQPPPPMRVIANNQAVASNRNLSALVAPVTKPAKTHTSNPSPVVRAPIPQRPSAAPKVPRAPVFSNGSSRKLLVKHISLL